MAIYTKSVTPTGTRYQRQDNIGRMVYIKASSLPHTVLHQFTTYDVPRIEYDDKPERKRCLFCADYQSHQRIYQDVMVALCDFHYYDKTIGQIAAELRKIKEGQDHGVLITSPQSRRKEKQSSVAQSAK